MGGGGGGVCVPTTCEEAGQSCGTLNDRCGTELSCGTCDSPLSCGGGGAPKVCGLAGAPTNGCRGGWCWVTPLPQGNTLFAVWARTAMDWWAVGAKGTVLHGTGSSGGMLETGTEGDLRAISGAAADDVWAVGDLSALHWNGTGWSHYPLPFMQDVYVAGSNDVWATGRLGGTHRWNGTRWLDTGSFGANSVWGSSTTDVWTVGDFGYIRHWDGTVWSSVPSGTTQTLFTVRGLSSNDIWAGGDNGLLLHWDGTAWQQVNVGAPLMRMAPLWPVSASLLFIGSSVWNGSSLTNHPAAGNLASVWGSSGSDVWGVGGGGNLAHFDGVSWSPMPQQLPNGLLNTSTLWASGPADVRIGYTGGTARWNGSSLTNLNAFTASPGGRARLWGPDTTNLWAASGTALHRWDDVQGWVAVTLPSSQPDAYVVTGSSPTDVWVWGATAISHWNGVSWSPRPGITNVFSILSFSANDAWAVGPSALLAHWNGTTWATYPGYAGTLRAVWGLSPNDVWVVGEQGQALHWNGAVWTATVTGTTASLGAISGTASNDLWAVGDRGTLLHWDGAAWSTSPSPTVNNLNAVLAVPGGGVWATGNYGTVIRRP